MSSEATVTRSSLLGLLNRSDKAVGEALLRLLARQTSEERQARATRESNSRGFTAFDAEILTSLAEFYRRAGFLTNKQLPKARAKVVKYWRQLLEEAEARGRTVDYGRNK